jgi:hypothetical protein
MTTKITSKINETLLLLKRITLKIIIKSYTRLHILSQVTGLAESLNK